MFTCPFCALTSHNPKDEEFRWCANCYVFVDDVINATPTIRKHMVNYFQKSALRRPLDQAAKFLRAAHIWQHGSARLNNSTDKPLSEG